MRRRHGSGRWLTEALAFSVALGASTMPSRAETPEPSETEILRDVENPLGRAWIVKLKSTTDLLALETFSTRRLEPKLEVQPRLSVPLTENWLVVTRPGLEAFVSKPYEADSDGLSRAAGLGDLEIPIVLSPQLGPRLGLGAGPTFIAPTASTRETGEGKWQAGPAAIVGWQDPDWLVALFVEQWWSFAGSTAKKEVSKLSAQYFLTRYFEGGWSLGMSPTISVDWKAARGEQLTFPVGLGVAKAFGLGHGRALQFSLQIEYMPIHPDEFGKLASLQLTLTPVMAQPFERPVLTFRARPGPGALEEASAVRAR
ncbi:hypothetical protein MYXO_00492 [Myxococcaceae bacterium]|nr:hypothetical protein MYXO_00492 [Myxococcaceae bacterium]